MAICVSSDAMGTEGKQLITENLLLPTVPTEKEGYELEEKPCLILDSSFGTRSGFFVRSLLTETESRYDKIQSTGFSFNNPWLPANAFKLLNKLKKAVITEKELVSLMRLVAERASVHFQLTEGKFFAATFYGRIVEISDTRVGLLKKIQGRNYGESIFVWRVGSNAFSGRI